jgi:plasmid stabilization system protein ParE
MTSVFVVAEAEAQLAEIADWWREHRPEASASVVDEFERCVTLLEHSPDVGARFQRSRIPGVRRVLMRRTKNFVYYLHDADHQVVYILAVWGTPKQGAPVLHPPR